MASSQQEQQEREIAPASRGNSNRIASLNLDGQSPPCTDDYDQQSFVRLVNILTVSCELLAVETDLQAGANHGYELLWVILIGLIFALIIQSLAANLGVSTGRHLAELCKAEYPKYVRWSLWLLAEMAVIAADIPEGMKLELLISAMVFTMAACFFGELSYVKPPASGVLKGMFIPKLSGQGATGDAIALLGALVMPHNLFLHSALVLSRKVPNSVRGINDACRYFLIESGFALFVAFLINVSVVSVSGTVCMAKNLSPENADQCGDLTLKSASFLLKKVLGKSSSTIYAIALLASGQSSTITGTYAGQYIMQIIVISWTLGLMIIGINVYYLSTAFVGWLTRNNLPKIGNVIIGIIVFPLMAIYILAIIYLTFRKDTAVTYIDPVKNDPNLDANMENGQGKSNQEMALGRVPYREDLADVPLPE
ncbi:hypothetical protein Peur_010365 [Populus x canadensis]